MKITFRTLPSVANGYIAQARGRLAHNGPLRRLRQRFTNQAWFSNLYLHDLMLADRVRVGAYRTAIGRHVQPGQTVIDLGTGSGILAFMAAQRGATVHAIEAGGIIEAAEEVAADNGLEGVRFHRMHSTAFTLPEAVDVILHEQIGGALFDEHMVANVTDLRDRLLKPGGKILPAYFDLFIEPVELVETARVPFAWDQRIDGIDYRRLRALEKKQGHTYRFIPLPAGSWKRYLTQPEPVLSIDLNTVGAGDLPRTISYSREATTSGTLDGFACYFRARFDDEIGFTNSPDVPPTSWVSPLLRVAPRAVASGEMIDFALEAGDLAEPRTWRWW